MGGHSFEWPSWLITVVDGSAAVMLWFGYRRGVEAPRLGLVLTVAASVIMWGRAAWMVFVPVLMVVTIGGSAGRIIAAASPALSSQDVTAQSGVRMLIACSRRHGCELTENGSRCRSPTRQRRPPRLGATDPGSCDKPHSAPVESTGGTQHVGDETW